MKPVNKDITDLLATALPFSRTEALAFVHRLYPTLAIYPWGAGVKKDLTEREAEVECKVKHKRWVAWDDRHLANNPTNDGYHRARCNTCPTGQDQTRYSGRFRQKGQI